METITASTIESFKEPEYPSNFPSIAEVVAAARKETIALEGAERYFKRIANKRFEKRFKNEKAMIEKKTVLRWIKKAYEEGFKEGFKAAKEIV